MSVPVNPPEMGRIENRFLPVVSLAFTHGGSDMDLTDGSAHPGFQYADELYPLATGNIDAVLAGDGTTARTYPVTAGVPLQGIFTVIKSTSTVDCIARRGLS